MKNQFGFFLSLIVSTALIILIIFIFLYQDLINPATLNAIAYLNLQGLEYKSANGFLESLIYYTNITIPAIDIYAGYYYNPHIREFIINETKKNVVFYFQNKSFLLYFNFDGEEVGLCYNKYVISYDLFINGENKTIYVCPPSFLITYYYNITCT
ncbi:MAG: hypothetical protein ACP5G1_03145 [Nanopusillaceae archaeon]